MENTKKIELDIAIKNGDTEINEFSLRKPLGGDLRGVNLMDLMNMKIEALATVLPRISTPVIHEHQVYQLELSDIANVFAGIFSFLPQNN